LKFDVNDKLSLGVSAIYYNDMTLDGKISATTYYAKVDPAVLQQLSVTLDGLEAMGQISAADKQQILGVYSGQKVVLADEAPGTATMPLPMTVGAGFAYKATDKLLFSGDLSWTQWAAWDVIPIDMDDGTKTELVENWESGIRFGLGAEYCVTEKLGIRAGYYTEPAAPPDETLTITIPDPGRRHGINLGVSYDFGLFKFFASYEKLLIGDRTVTDWKYDTASSSFDNMAGTYKMNVNNIMAGLNFAF
jgi:long-subunit fatty acid transport protein